MGETVISSVAEFQIHLQELESEEAGFLYRGQADAAWKVHCSAARRLTENSVTPIDPRLISHLLVSYLEYIIAKARLLNYVPHDLPEDSPDLVLLAQLQHHGAATGLIDFTRQPLVALWIACNEHREKDGAVYLLPRSATVEVSSRTELNNNIQFFYEEDKLWSWEPAAALGQRILAQKSVFVFGVPEIGREKTRKFVIRAENKTEIIHHLEAVCGISEEELFPDFSGYAVANASAKPFDVRHTVSYWQKQIGLASGDLDKAKAHFKYGVALSAIGDSPKAIEQYDSAANLNPRDATTYANRGQSKAMLGLHEEAIADFAAALRITPDNAVVYYKRGLARKDLRQYASAKRDFERAKTLAQEQGIKELLSYINHELNNLNVKPFRVIPHSSEYVPGVDPDRLKEKLHDLDDELFLRKSLK